MRARMLKITRPMVMGILNVTPDSFADGGRYLAPDHALERARQMIDEGVDIIDVGGESTRPGAAPVRVDEELARVVPVIEAIKAQCRVAVSVDTSTPEVMTAAAAAGADLINDVRALQREGALAAAAASGLPVCLMHMQGEPRTMQDKPAYDDIVGEIIAFFAARLQACDAAGIGRDKVLLDPGFGFGKTAVHNLQLINRLQGFVALGQPVLVGASRKSTIGLLLGDAEADRLQGSVAMAIAAFMRGASVLRVHDVAATVQALRVVAAVETEQVPG